MATKCRMLIVVFALVLVTAIKAQAQTGQKNFRAELTGFQEVPTLSTSGVGTIWVRISPDDSLIHFRLSYANLEGSVTVAHFHFGMPATTGGVMAWICGGGGRDACPQSGTVTGTIAASDIVGPAAQGIAPGEFAEAVRAIRYGAVYANVHSSLYPSGEIRGQLRADQGN